MATQNPDRVQGGVLDPATVQDFRNRVRGALLESAAQRL